MPTTVESSSDASGLRVTVLVTRWYGEVVGRLRDAAVATLLEGGVADADITVVEVPGAYELPQAAGWVARAADADAIVALGCVIRGETAHFDYVAGACCEGLMQVALETGIPVGLGVITAETQAQADARSGEATGKGGNKGIEAAEAALQMALTYRALEERRKP
ncbi:MAG: 6,7-dimethyl-8-ribityllumazine synthase [Planctomycetota bacterium]|nr:6,7-dimethyl-8-ribityllumazine synthase [Planctomycetota bacterium]